MPDVSSAEREPGPRSSDGENLRRVVEDDAKRVALSRSHAAHAVPEIDSILALRAAHRPVVHRERDGIALAQRANSAPKLLAFARFASANASSSE